MYRQEKPLILMSTASAIPNNLAVDQMGHRRFADQVAVIHPGYISIIPIDCEEQKTKYVAVRSSAGEAALAQVSQETMLAPFTYFICLINNQKLY